MSRHKGGCAIPRNLAGWQIGVNGADANSSDFSTSSAAVLGGCRKNAPSRLPHWPRLARRRSLRSAILAFRRKPATSGNGILNTASSSSANRIEVYGMRLSPTEQRHASCFSILPQENRLAGNPTLQFRPDTLHRTSLARASGGRGWLPV